MQKISSKIFYFLLVSLFLVPREVQSAKPIKTVIIFFAYNPTLPAYQNMLEGFYSTFSEERGVSCNLVIEYLDLARPKNEIVVKTIVDMYNDNYKNIPVDLLIVVGPSGYPALSDHGLKLLEKTPTICIDNDTLIRDTLRYPLHSNVIHVELKYDFYNTLKNAFALFPGYKTAYVINGSTPLDAYYKKKFKMAAKRFESSHSFRYVTNLSIDSLLLFIENIPRKNLVFVPSYYQDKNGLPYTTPDVIALISRRSKCPVLPVADNFIVRKGALGGHVYSFKNVGKEIGRIANLILEGANIQHIKIRYTSLYDDIYDWQEVNRWGLTNSKIIRGASVFYYKPTTFLAEYRWYILAFFIFLLSQFVVIIYLIRLNRRQKETARQKVETEKIYHEMVREDRLLKMVELTASLSHELNQPLTAILYNAQAGKRFLKTGKLNLKQTEEIFNNIIEDDKRAGGIISSVKNLMKLETREMENVDLGSLVEETVNIFYSESITKGVSIKFKLPATPIWIYGEKIQLQQVLLNLFRNSMNAMENNKPGNKILEIMLNIARATVTVSVRDTGCGIDPAIRDKLFKAFVTGSKKGFGIGLALSRTIIEKHQGEIWANNAPGGGAEFSFRLKTIRES